MRRLHRLDPTVRPRSPGGRRFDSLRRRRLDERGGGPPCDLPWVVMLAAHGSCRVQRVVERGRESWTVIGADRRPAADNVVVLPGGAPARGPSTVNRKLAAVAAWV
jgi:hypothetical protein